MKLPFGIKVKSVNMHEVIEPLALVALYIGRAEGIPDVMKDKLLELLVQSVDANGGKHMVELFEAEVKTVKAEFEAFINSGVKGIIREMIEKMGEQNDVYDT